MKIVSTPDHLDELGKQKLRRMRANLDCHKCPNCGETRDTFDQSCQEESKRTGKLHGISNGIVSTEWVRGKFFSRDELSESDLKRFFVPGHFVHKDEWKCYECGTKWESDPW